MQKTKTQSPWLEQLDRKRAKRQLFGSHHCDVAVIGAGIAGVTTAYFLLTRTNKNILLVESGRVAHGATGHNAGQIASYFEKPFAEIVSEFGLKMAVEGEELVKSSWDLLADIRADLRLETECHVFNGYAGIVDKEELLDRLKEKKKKASAGGRPEMIYVSDAFIKKAAIPASYKRFYTVISSKSLMDVLQTKDKHYIAALSSRKGCMNSAKFSEEVVRKLLERYSGRLMLTEHTHVNKIALYKRYGILEAASLRARAKRIVLCTNGFENFTIQNHAGANIDVKFHHLVRGSIGYMAAFEETPQMAPTAISYLPTHLSDMTGAYDSEPYYYLTRRPTASPEKGLVCIGGPESHMDDSTGYRREHPYPEEAKKMIEKFVAKTYRHAGKTLRFTHLWHGLMGYTPNGIRCVGPESCNPVLMYNLGCNGVGILPSVYGSFRISQMVNGEQIDPSIFDPVDLRCSLPGEQQLDNRPADRLKRILFSGWKTAAWCALMILLALILRVL